MENLTVHKTVAYLRVSTAEQHTEKNKTDILHFANQYDLGKVHFVEEVCSGKTPWRERLIAQLLEELKPHDVIIVSELSRLGRSMLECMEILAFATRKVVAFTRSKEIGNSMTPFKAKLLHWLFQWRLKLNGI